MLKKAPLHRPDVGDVSFFTGDAVALDRKYRRGWRIADGNDGTPSMIDKFPKMEAFANRGQSGGAKTVTPSGSVTVTVANKTLAAANMPSHNHTQYAESDGGNGNYYPARGIGDTPLATYVTGSAGSSSAHNHSGSGSFSGSSQTNEPQYFTSVPLYYTGVPGTYGG